MAPALFRLPRMHNDITALILAGGQARRLQGEDKGLVRVCGQSLISYVIRRLQPQVEQIIISANRNLDAYETFGFPVISDRLSDFPGPLAGIHSAMQQIRTGLLLTAPCDAPFISPHYAARMLETFARDSQHNAVVARDDKGIQPVFALLSCALLPSLEQYLLQGNRKVQEWIMQQQPGLADFGDQENMFFNMNTAGDKQLLETLLHEETAP